MNLGVIIILSIIVALAIALILYTIFRSTSQQDSNDFIISLPKNIFLPGEKTIYGPKVAKVYSGHFSSVKTLIATNKRVMIFGDPNSGSLLSLWYRMVQDKSTSRLILNAVAQTGFVSIYLKDNPTVPIQIRLNEFQELANYINQQL